MGRLVARYEDWVPTTAEGRYGAAVEAGHASIAAEPQRERTHLLLAAYLAEGNASEALRQYRSFRAGERKGSAIR